MNTKTNEKITCNVLKPTDAEQYGPVRSGRSCKRGNEFFKVFINGKVYKMNNSLREGSCLSDDRLWEFTGEKITCGLQKSKIKRKSKKTKTEKLIDKTKEIEFVSHKALSKII
jgi:hypothetical protein